MEKDPEFIGREYTKEEIADLQNVIAVQSGEALKPIDGELEKSDEDISIIDAANEALDKELWSLGIEDYISISQNKVHILPENIFNKKFPDYANEKSIFISNEDAIYINKSEIDSKIDFFICVLKEIVRHASSKKFYADEQGNIFESKLGYQLNSAWKKHSDHIKLAEFNEIIVSYTVYKIIAKNINILTEKLNISKEDIGLIDFQYLEYYPIIELIKQKISVDKNILPKKVFSDLEKGQFEPSILVLKNIDKSFGRGSLEILSLLGTFEDENENIELTKKITSYFKENDDEKRKKIKNEIKKYETYIKISHSVRSKKHADYN